MCIRDSPNTTSGRLSLYYTVAVALIERSLTPDAFTAEKLKDPKYAELRGKITAKRHDAYGDGPKGIRACILEVYMKAVSYTHLDVYKRQARGFSID